MLLTRKPWIVPIPGTRKVERSQENIVAGAVELTPGIADHCALGSIPGALGTRSAENVVVQPDGKIVLGGWSQFSVEGYALARINPRALR